MTTTLITWIGYTDLRASHEEPNIGIGPIAQALDQRSFDNVLLLADFQEKEMAPFRKWLGKRTTAALTIQESPLSSPTDFSDVYKAAVRACEEALAKKTEKPSLVFHISPGTPAMAAVWILLSKTRFPAELIESSLKHGVKTVSVPFDISAEFIPDLLREQDSRLHRLSGVEPPEARNLWILFIAAEKCHVWWVVLAKLRFIMFPYSSKESLAPARSCLRGQLTARALDVTGRLLPSIAARFLRNLLNPSFLVTRRGLSPAPIKSE